MVDEESTTSFLLSKKRLSHTQCGMAVVEDGGGLVKFGGGEEQEGDLILQMPLFILQNTS